METPCKGLKNKYLESTSGNTLLEIPSSPLIKNLGYGTGVSVFKLERSPRGISKSPWVVKRISSRFRKTNSVFEDRLQSEAAILRKLSHPNIVGFRAFNEGNLLLEYCHTSLGQILEERLDQNFGPLEEKYIMKMIVDILNALVYLHMEARILHCDLKSFNILVKKDFEICKLCDFGVSLPFDSNGEIDLQKYPNCSGTDLWSAPEVLDRSIVTCKADIFSFGLVIYETVALIPPHTLGSESNAPHTQGEESNPNDDSSIDSRLLQANTSQDSSIDSFLFHENVGNLAGTRPPLPNSFNFSEEYTRVLEIFYVCTNACPEDRPHAKDLLNALNDNLNTDNQTSKESCN